MLKRCRPNILSTLWQSQNSIRSVSSARPDWLDVRPAVLSALKFNKPVVAFETAIVTHGLPKPINFELNTSAINICNKYGVTPAPIGFVDGKLVVGLSLDELADLAKGGKDVEKIARLDIAKAVYKRLNGGTTVSSTMWAAYMSGIKVFVTGGIGGVHRGWQESFDISSDLTELSRTPVAVVCAGVKSILDIPATLEYLETMGVPVATMHPNGDFPAFHSSSSGIKIPLRLRSHNEAVSLIQAHFSMNPTPSGILIACPIPEKSAIPSAVMEQRIQAALKLAASKGITGKATTPFLLSEIAKASSGETVKANVELVLNNTDAGCRIALGLATDDTEKKQSVWNISNVPDDKDVEIERPVIVGGSVLDAYGKFEGPTPKEHTRATELGRVFLSAGGVGRNVAECVARVMNVSETTSTETQQDKRPLLVSVLSNDAVGQLIVSLTSKKLDVGGVKWLDRHKTGLYSPSYVGHLDKNGQYLLGIGDFVAMEQLLPDDLKSHAQSITKAPLVVVDGNLHPKVYPALLEACAKNQVPVYIECTDIYKATRAFSEAAVGKDINKDHIACFDSVAAISPNLEEFLQLVKYFLGQEAYAKCKGVKEKSKFAIDDLAPLVKAGKQLVLCRNFAPNVFLKMGPNGVVILRRSSSSSALPIKPWTKSQIAADNSFSAVFYGAEPAGMAPKIVSVSGAGDCFIGTIIGLTLSGANNQATKITIDAAVRAGIRAACLSLESELAVPHTITPEFLSSDECAQWCAKLPSRDVSHLASD